MQSYHIEMNTPTFGDLVDVEDYFSAHEIKSLK